MESIKSFQTFFDFTRSSSRSLFISRGYSKKPKENISDFALRKHEWLSYQNFVIKQYEYKKKSHKKKKAKIKSFNMNS